MMKIGSHDWINLVLDGARKLDVAVSPDQVCQFAQHAQWLLQWNRKVNLTTITDPFQIAVKHFLDAVAPIQYIPAQGPLLDIGTGGGFPGIPLKILRPEQPMTLIDSVRKKANFVKHVIRELGLRRTEASHMRAQVLCRQTPGRRFAVVVCRAVADVKGAVRLAAPLVRPNGRIILYQGPRLGQDLKDCLVPNHLVVDGNIYRHTTMTYALPFIGDARRITVLEFEKPSPVSNT
jgi:16S rRNA (guanine527-N7)-methyltransferase